MHQSPQFFISLVRMHHISNLSKFRRLKRHATQANVSGLVKIKKPGILVFEGEQTAIKSFLENAKGLRYLDFHHLDTKPFIINSNNKIRLADSKPGLHEVENMNELVKALDAIGEKEWFKQQMGMKRNMIVETFTEGTRTELKTPREKKC